MKLLPALGLPLCLLLPTFLGCDDDTSRRPMADASTAQGGGDAPLADAAVAAPLDLGPGYNATVTVDPAGNGYISWIGAEPLTSSLHFCMLPRGSAACLVRTTITTEGTSLSRPFVVVSGATVKILSYRYGLLTPDFAAVFLFTSIDGGKTFGPGRKVGSIPFSAAVPGPNDSVSLTTHAYTKGLAYQQVRLDETPAPALIPEAILSSTHLYNGAVALDQGVTPVVVFATGDGAAQVRKYIGQGDLNAQTSWTPALDIGPGDRMHLVSGSSGVFMLSQVDSALQVRRFDGSTFGPDVQLPEGSGELAHAHMVYDLGGQLHVVWPSFDVQGVRLNYAVSDQGTTWSQRIAVRDEGFGGVRAAVAADHKGFAVWETSASSPMAHVHVLHLEPARL